MPLWLADPYDPDSESDDYFYEDSAAGEMSEEEREIRLMRQYREILAQYNGSASAKPLATPVVPVHEPRGNAAGAPGVSPSTGAYGANTAVGPSSGAYGASTAVGPSSGAYGASTAVDPSSGAPINAQGSALEVVKLLSGSILSQAGASGQKLSAGQRLYLERWPVPAQEVQVLKQKTAYTVKTDHLIVFDDCDEAARAMGRLKESGTVRIEIIAGPRGMYIDASGNERWAPMSGLAKK